MSRAELALYAAGVVVGLMLSALFPGVWFGG
jgi:hypothetical protein